MTDSFMMDCEESRRLIPLFLDDELDGEQSLLLEGHLDGCVACQKELEREGELRLALRRAAERVVAPVALRERIQAELRQEESSSQRWSKWVPLAAAAALLMVLGSNGLMKKSPGDFELLTARHAGNLPMDIAGGEWGDVQSYLNTRLPFAVGKPVLVKTPGLNLMGGRVTQLGHRDAAFVRYRARGGNVSMFVYQGNRIDDSDLKPLYRMGHRKVSMTRMRGMNIAHWQDGDLVYSIVTELPASDLREVLRAHQAH